MATDFVSPAKTIDNYLQEFTDECFVWFRRKSEKMNIEKVVTKRVEFEVVWYERNIIDIKKKNSSKYTLLPK